jgi:hypothetical protein
MRIDPKFKALHEEPQWQQLVAANTREVARERSEVNSMLAPPRR